MKKKIVASLTEVEMDLSRGEKTPIEILHKT